MISCLLVCFCCRGMCISAPSRCHHNDFEFSFYEIIVKVIIKMDKTKIPLPEILKEAILELEEPILFRGIIDSADCKTNWKLLEMDNFIKLTEDMPLAFRVGLNAKTSEPQWDVDCPVKMMTMMEFLDIVQNNNINDEKWYYFDYKYMHEWFKLKPEILKAVDWKPFGFDKSGEDSTLWIGSKGAHTNCHQDSYGCNLIAQLHGKKEWLLFPPNSGNDLKQTRVPYEESTIYSKINFFCPSKDDENGVLKFIETPKLVVLEPGDVLFVPKGWWHYVESLDTTLSINIWLPLDSDNEARLREALVKLVMTRLGEGLPSAEDGDKFDSLQNSILLIKECIKQCHQREKENNEEILKKKKAYWNPSKLAQEYPLNISKLLNLSKEELKEFLINKRERFSSSNDINCSTIKAFSDKGDMYILKSIVDTFCHSDVLDKVAKVLLTENHC